MEKRRVVVTGLGAVTAIGIGAEAFWNSLKAGQVGIDRITQFDTEKFKVKLAAEVKDFKAADFMDVKSARRMERFSQFAVAAAKEALADSGLDLTKEDPYMAGCAIGSGIGSLQSVEREYNRMITKGPNMVNPLFVPMMISNMAAGNVAIQCGLKGKNINIVTACASGTHNVGEAFRTIAHGDADIMLAGGAEKELTLSFPEVRAEELLGDIRLPAIGGIEDESPFAMEFLLAPGEEPSEHIANEILAERDALRALCAEKKLSLRFFLKEEAAAERGSCKELKQIFSEAFYRLADFDACEETLARKLFLEPGQLPLSILRRGRESAVFSAAGYRVGLIDLMLELRSVGEKGASSL